MPDADHVGTHNDDRIEGNNQLRSKKVSTLTSSLSVHSFLGKDLLEHLSEGLQLLVKEAVDEFPA